MISALRRRCGVGRRVVGSRPRRGADTRLVRGRARIIDDRGGVTPFVLLFVVPMVVMAGLAFDGGRVLSERREAFDVAQSAAFAAAQAVDGTALRQGTVAIDPGLVHNAAADYLSSQGHSGTVTVSDTTVTVVVTSTVDMQLLSAVGVGTKTVTGTASARLVRGVEGADT